eukprot:symbB.v1.2.034133.t2/scaffold4356.1/size40753/3
MDEPVFFTVTSSEDPTPLHFQLGATDDPLKVGRNKKCGIVVNQPGVSWVHLEIKFSPQTGGLSLRDLSTNGVGLRCGRNDSMAKVEKEVDTEIPSGATLTLPFRVRPTQEELQTTLTFSIDGVDSPSSELTESEEEAPEVPHTEERKGKRKKHEGGAVESFSFFMCRFSTLISRKHCQFSFPRVSRHGTMARRSNPRHWAGALSSLVEADQTRLKKSIIQCSTAISACATADLWKQSLQLFYVELIRLRPDTIACNSAISGCSRSRQWQEAAEMLMAMPLGLLRSNIITLNTVIFACHGHLWHWVGQLLQEVQYEQLQSDLISYNTSMKLIESQHWQMSLHLLENMRCHVVNADSSSYTANLNSSDKKPWPILLQLFTKQNSKAKDLEGKNATISACGKAEWQHAISILRHGFSDVITFNATIAACDQHWQKGLQLLLEMKETKMQGTVISYTSAISQYWQSSWHLLEEVQQMALQVNLIMRNAAISAGEEGGYWQEAVHAVQHLELPADVISYNAAISACEKGHHWQSARCLLDGIDLRSIQPNMISFNSSLSACEKGGMWQTALQRLEFHRDQHVDVLSFNATISACEKAREWHWAMDQIHQLEIAGLQSTSISCCAVIAALCSCWHWRLALLLPMDDALDVMIGACEVANAPGHSATFFRRPFETFRDPCATENAAEKKCVQS